MRRAVESRWLAPAALAALVLLVYGMTLRAPFVYDDTGLTSMPFRSLPPTAFARAVFSRDYLVAMNERTYQPLVTLFHYAAAGRPAVLRAAGWLLHLLSAWLLFSIGRALGLDETRAALAAALFVVFPLQTEAVDISAFKGHLLAAFFGLAALRACIAARAGPPRRGAVVAMCALLALSLLAKETGVVALGLTLAYVLLLGRASAHEKALHAAACGALAAGYALWRFGWLAAPPALPESFGRPVLASLGWYLSRLAAPWPPCLERELGWTPAPLLALPAFALACWLARRDRRKLFCLAWVVIALLPFLHLLRFANFSPVADRYLYLAVGGFCLLAGLVAERPAARLALVGLLVAWGVGSILRNGSYRDPLALYSQTVACAPRSPRAHYVLARERFGREDFAGAESQARQALALRDSAEVLTLLGDTYWVRGMIRPAVAEFERARRALPDWDARYPDESRFLNGPRPL